MTEDEVQKEPIRTIRDVLKETDMYCGIIIYTTVCNDEYPSRKTMNISTARCL